VTIRNHFFIFSILLFFSAEISAKGPRNTKTTGAKLPIPFILPEVTFNKRNISAFQFEFNNCDGGSWETVVFKNKNGILVLVSFNTPGIAGAVPKQVALIGLTAKQQFIRGIRGTFDLVNPSRDSNGRIKKTLQGTLTLDEESQDPKSGAISSISVMEPIQLEGLSFSRTRPFDFDSMLSDLRSIPGLEKAKLTKMCE